MSARSDAVDEVDVEVRLSGVVAAAIAQHSAYALSPST